MTFPKPAIYADAARDWQEARRADAGRVGQTLTDEDYYDMADEARDWWAGLTDAERAAAESEYFENCSDEVNSCWSYLDIFRAKAEGHIIGKQAYDLRLTSGGTVDRRCKLTPDRVEYMRSIYAHFKGRRPFNMRFLARAFGLSVSTVCKTLNDQYWKNKK